MKRRNVVFAIGCWLGAVGCSEPAEKEENSCDLGRSLPCSCSNGMQGAQVCQDDGTLGECVCEPGAGGTNAGTGGSNSGGNGGSTASGGAQPSGGSGARPNTGGSTGLGGTTETGGSAGSGIAGTGGIGGSDPDNWVNVTVTYDGSYTRELSHIYNVMPYYVAMEGSGHFSYQVEDGYTQVIFNVQPGDTQGSYEVGFWISESFMELPARIRGAYHEGTDQALVTYLPLEESCVTFTELNVGFGGVVAGTLDCMLYGGNDTTLVPAVATGSFHAVFPE